MPFPESFQVPNSSLVVRPGRVSIFRGIQNTITSAAWRAVKIKLKIRKDK
jgi:hypothetical protein